MCFSKQLAVVLMVEAVLVLVLVLVPVLLALLLLAPVLMLALRQSKRMTSWSPI
jgi:hypothetical protein